MKGEKSLLCSDLAFEIIYYFRNMAPEIVYRRQDIYICTLRISVNFFFSLINLVMVMRAMVELLAEDKPSNGNDDGGRVANC